jgi:hypothetical protein
LPDVEGLEEFNCAADVVCVRVRCDEVVDVVDAEPLQSLNNLLTRCGRPRVDKDVFARRRDDEDGVAQVNVEDVNLQLLPGSLRHYARAARLPPWL